MTRNDQPLPLVGKSFDPNPFLAHPEIAQQLSLKTDLGALFETDCTRFLESLKDEVADTFFADPPFNLKKDYGPGFKDNLSPKQYIEWCHTWIDEGIRTLRPGGAFFLYNIPKWNYRLATYLEDSGLQFRHWITINIKFGLPIQGRLYPSHYSLLYFTKGKPKTFRKLRTPIEKCRHCGRDIKDYGGHRHAMNPKGVNLTDVWTDIPPVRHSKYKSSKRPANALSTKVLDRVVFMSTYPGDVVIDPFGGSGTTFAVCERNHRHWLGADLFSTEAIHERLQGDLFYHKNTDVIDE